jgi:hypothetical protein
MKHVAPHCDVAIFSFTISFGLWRGNGRLPRHAAVGAAFKRSLAGGVTRNDDYLI